MTLSKYRVYIDDPSEAPDDVEVEEGPEGGLYYERESGGDSSDGSDGSGEESQQGTFGDFGEADEEYDISSDFGRQVVNSLVRDDKSVVSEIAANEWMSNAGSIDDPDLLTDALEPITDHGTKTARDRIRRRLRGLGWNSEEIDDAIELEEPEADTHREWQKLYDSDNVEEVMSLSEGGAAEGTNAGAMEIHRLEDGTEAYVMDATADNVAGFEESVNEQLTTYEAARRMGVNVPPHAYGDGWYAAREAEGEDLWEAPESWMDEVDDEEAFDQVAAMLITGNKDMNNKNIFVSEEGELSFIDLDHAGVKLDESPGRQTNWDEGLDPARKALFRVTDADDLSEIASELEKRAREKARGLRDEGEVDEIVEAASQHDEDIAENIRHNIDLLADGEEVSS